MGGRGDGGLCAKEPETETETETGERGWGEREREKGKKGEKTTTQSGLRARDVM